VAGRLAAWRTGTPVVTSLVNTSYDAGRRRDPNVAAWRLAVVRSVEGWTARRLTASFHAISEAVAAAAVHALGIRRDRITVVPRGRDRTRLGDPSPARRAEARRRLDIAPDASVVVTVGRQEYQKGQRTLVDAVARMRHPALLLVVGRQGAATAEVETAARPLGPRVRLLGHRTDVPDILAAADVFAFPSRYEGLGGAVIEAMALGLPVVASDLPALREVVDADVTGVLVPPDDPATLASALDTLLADDSTRRRMGEAGRQRFLDRFTLDAVVDPMIAVLADAAGTVAGRGRPFLDRRPGANGA
jgi:glycosyltransferase involved in cell wall biosynthesis